MKAELKYFVITSLDTPKGYIRMNKPNVLRKNTKVTESSNSEDMPNYVHRKYCSEFNKTQLKELLNENWFETCKTMGALTIEYGFMDAISFNFENCDAYLNSYISPIISNENELISELDKLPETVKDIKISRIQSKLKRIMNLLYNLNPHNEIHLPESFSIDLNQIELELN